MTLILPRLQQSVEMTDKAGRPSLPFHRWWDTVATALEKSVNQLFDSLVQLGLIKPDGTINTDRVTTDSIQLNAVTNNELAPLSVSNESIQDDAVATASIIPDSVTERYIATNLSNIDISETTKTQILRLNIEKSISSSEIDIDVCIRLESTDDIICSVEVYRGSQLVDSFSPFIKGPGDTYRTSVALPFTEFNIPAGPHTYAVLVRREGGASVLSASKGCILRIKEIKR